MITSACWRKICPGLCCVPSHWHRQGHQGYVKGDELLAYIQHPPSRSGDKSSKDAVWLDSQKKRLHTWPTHPIKYMSMRNCMLQPVAMQPCCNPTQNQNKHAKTSCRMLQLVVLAHKRLLSNMRLVLVLLALLRVSVKITVLLVSRCFKVLFLQTMDILNTHTKTHTQHCAEQNTYRWVPQCAPQLSYDCLWALSSPGKGTCFPLALGTLHMEDHCTSLSVCYATEAIYMSTQQVTHTCEPVWPRGKALGW